MSTSPRILVSEHSVRAALAEWKAERDAAEREAGSQRTEESRRRVYDRTPAEYADELAPYVYSLLTKHSEAS